MAALLQIWKWELSGPGKTEIAMLKGSKILTVQMQHGRPCVWALVDPECRKADVKTFTVVGTGHPVPEDAGRYLGTVQMLDGSLVFHVFVAE